MFKTILLPILFALGTALFWGFYGPTIGNAAAPKVDGKPLWSPFKPYVFIGVAYVVIGIIGGLAMMKFKGDSFNYVGANFATAKWGFLAGSLGAFGALCLTSAMMYSRGNALLVMPIVFGGAVTVSALVSLWKYGESGSGFLWGGIAITVLGVAVTAMNTPHGTHSKGDKPAAHGEQESAAVSEDSTKET